jgi:hypothetical protein
VAGIRTVSDGSASMTNLVCLRSYSWVSAEVASVATFIATLKVIFMLETVSVA